jgi:hypothetical protein
MFNHLTRDNWQAPDPTSGVFAQRDVQTGDMREVTPDDWPGYFLAVELMSVYQKRCGTFSRLPEERCSTGRSSNPPYTLGSEQARRVADAAALHRYNELGGPKTRLETIRRLHAA